MRITKARAGAGLAALAGAVALVLGWQAVGRLALRQAPLSRPEKRAIRKGPDASEVSKVAGTLGAIEDDALKDALARLGASVGTKRPKSIK